VQSSSQIITTNKPTSNFLQAGCPSCRPTNSVKALKGKHHISWTCLPKLTWGLPTLSLTTTSSWLPRLRWTDYMLRSPESSLQVYLWISFRYIKVGFKEIVFLERLQAILIYAYRTFRSSACSRFAAIGLLRPHCLP